MAFKTEAIILHSRVLKGADRIYEVISPRDGRLSVVARSAAKSSSKMAGHLPSFAHVRLMVGRGRQDHLAGVTTIDSYRELRESWNDFILASSLVELLLRFNVPGQSASEEFELLRRSFDIIRDRARVQREKTMAARIFLWKLLSLSGWKPNVEQCAVCRESLKQGWSYYLPQKGFVCQRHGDEGMLLDEQLVPFLQTVLANDDWNHLLTYAGATDLQKQWFDISQHYYHDVINYPLESLKMLNYV